jgi:hypothetical protein
VLDFSTRKDERGTFFRNVGINNPTTQRNNTAVPQHSLHNTALYSSASATNTIYVFAGSHRGAKEPYSPIRNRLNLRH